MKKIYPLLLFISLNYSCSDTHAKKFIQAVSVNTYNFVTSYDPNQSIAERIAVPAGFKRVDAVKGSFADWLRHLPLKPGRPQVHLYNGKLKADQDVHYAVVNIDVGSTDLQQCADAVMRMRAEYLYSVKDYGHLHFNFTNGTSVGFKKWSEGYRTVVKGNKVSWVKSAAPGDNYAIFKSYCNMIFNYAGTSSLSKELKPVADLKDMQIGDVFIAGGFPGHAVLVVDVCENTTTGEKLFMIQQSYMPAQEIHILKNYTNAGLSPWYSVDFSGDLETPQWTFKRNQLMRF
ncbi:MAG: hypothetical protein JWO44_2729 [Bacteroidetes bacterium]|nr:hypothetical protein [Bacteroidota bacterium]